MCSCRVVTLTLSGSDSPKAIICLKFEFDRKEGMCYPKPISGKAVMKRVRMEWSYREEPIC